MSHSITDVKVTEQPDGEGNRRIIMAWTDAAGAPMRACLTGYSANKVSNEISLATAEGESQRQQYLVGLIRGISICEDAT